MGVPLVSVVLPTFNTKKEYLREAVDSILGQTYRNIELIVIDDGSIDFSASDVMESYSDSRIRFYRNPENRGLAYTLNRGIDLATGQYLARMDADDISLPERIGRSVRFLETHSEVSILGSAMREFGGGNRILRCPSGDDNIRALMVFQCPLNHPTVVFRLSVLRKCEVHYPETKCEDYLMWVNCALIPEFRFENLTEVLLSYRVHPGQITVRDRSFMKEHTAAIYTVILKALGLDLSGEDLDLYASFSQATRRLTGDEIDRVRHILRRVLSKDRDTPFCTERTLQKTMLKKCAKEALRQVIYGSTAPVALLRLVYHIAAAEPLRV